MKNLVLTICIGDEFKKLSEYTHHTIKAYAEKIRAEFLIIDSGDSPHWQKFKINDLLNIYDRIIYLDTDLIVRDDCPNLFDLVPYNKIGAFNESKFTQREYSLIETSKAYNVDPSTIPWNGKYYNTGVMVISKCHKNLFKKPELTFSSYEEQGYINLQIAIEEGNREKDQSLMYDLSYKFNRMTCLDFSGEERHASYIIHYAGYRYNTSVDSVIQIINGDLNKWKNDSPEYNYKRHILIIVSGGIGDQISAEPIIRYMKNVYKDEDISIVSHWPRLFKHLNYPVCKHEDFKFNNDIPYFKMPTFPDPTTVTYSVVSNLMTHTVDYCSMAALHRTLPLKDKVINLCVKDEDNNELDKILNGFDLSKSICIHAGRHWDSKSFPKEYWQELVNKLSIKYPICLIGTDDNNNRGAYQLDLPDNCINLIDRTNIGQLIATIGRSPVLISNDSAPIHIAGSFDNWIILLPTCKHPDHVLPFRLDTNGNINQYHKAFAMYKKLTIDDCDQRPTTWIDGGASAEHKSGDWSEYLPEIDTIVSKIEMIDI